MGNLPRRYRFDNASPPDQTVHEPVPVVPAEETVPTVPVPTVDGGRLVVQHIHQAPPDRTVQRLALGAGMGGGVLAAGVYFGPLLIAALTSMAISLAVVALLVVVVVWGLSSASKTIRDNNCDTRRYRRR
ncbi:DUF6251 family protein [Streptomyces albidoflavus]|uniref:DUF6251 family protein n=1 Tax=Streptomyces albidoflavus TaxID=1886 RepID=UPI00052543A0